MPRMSTALPAPTRADRFLRRGAKVLGLGVAISLLLSLGLGLRLATSLAYSVPISLSCWFFIDGGRLLAARWVHRHGDTPQRGWPGWHWMSLAIVLGTMAGYAVGQQIGDLLSGGARAPWPIIENPRHALAMLLFSLVPALGATYYFFARERLAASEAQAQASQRQAAETQLRLLESQLEPHMLFNTLANLRVLIALDPPRAQAMLDQLIAFLRATLEASRVGQHALRAEFARLADYLALMQVRMGARLQTRLVLPSELADRPVPPLLLQPLVENAIKHGLEPKIEGGRIEVEARRDGDSLVLSVRDTGVGVAAPPSTGSAFGLAQVRERLATLYGARAALTLAPADDAEGGMLATVRLPLES